MDTEEDAVQSHHGDDQDADRHRRPRAGFGSSGHTKINTTDVATVMLRA